MRGLPVEQLIRKRRDVREDKGLKLQKMEPPLVKIQNLLFIDFGEKVHKLNLFNFQRRRRTSCDREIRRESKEKKQ